ncbi:hypothetical protein L2E82_25903 [Cichorium intybus]|uniref:Uncharacterized protein n=1 Tax=Cichorium intybus TaxID=13427 RepID=A0ACB9E4G7_CICIN|nr:hypothetical protein L2E82_25903 [Cichorium intybus]
MHLAKANDKNEEMYDNNQNSPHPLGEETEADPFLNGLVNDRSGEDEPNKGPERGKSQSPNKAQEPNNTAHNPILDNQNIFEDCSHALKILLSKETPIKQKLKLLEEDKVNGKEEMGSQTAQISERRNSQISPRITRSKARRKRVSDSSKIEIANGDTRSEESTSLSGISSRVEEIGVACGFNNGRNQGKGRRL